MKSHITYGVVGLFFALSTVSSASSQALTLEETIKRTQAAHPQFRAYSALQRASKADIDNRSLAPPIILSGEADNLIGNGNYQQTTQAEFTLALSSVIELGGQRNARRQQALSAYELSDAQSKAQTLSLLSDATRAFIMTLASQERLALATESLHLNEQALAVVDKRHQRGAAPVNDRLRAEAAVERASSTLKQARMQLNDDIYRLTNYWLTANESRDEIRLTGDLYDTGPKAAEFSQLLKTIDNALVLEVYASQARLAEAGATLAQAESTGGVDWRLGLTHFADSGDKALSAGVSAPLFSGRRGVSANNAARQRSVASEYQYLSHKREVTQKLHTAWSALKRHSANVEAYRQKIIPLLKQAMNEVGQGYAQGRYRYQDWQIAQEELIEAQHQLITSATGAQISRTLIEELTATAVSNQTTQDAPL